MASAPVVHGYCDPEFQRVADEFERNFIERGEVGAAVAIHVDGACMVDLWAGIADPAVGSPWREDTITRVWSSTKGVAATCLHMLADRGKLDFDAPVTRYWPEFGANGKEGITVAMVLSHQAGLPVWQRELAEDALLDWSLATGRLAEEAPLWEPGTAVGYHAVTLGFLEGELLRRIDGRTIGTFLREELAGPLNADIWIGLPEAQHERVAPQELAEPNVNTAFYRKMTGSTDWFGVKLVTNSPEVADVRRLYSAELPASGGMGNARALARIYSPLALDGSAGGVRIVGPEGLAGMRLVRAAVDCDVMLRLPTTFTLGYSKSWGARVLGQGSHVILGEHAFGTPGFGGSIGFADADARMSFGYVMNRHGVGVGLNDRGQSLVDAAYRSVGFRQSSAGCWAR